MHESDSICHSPQRCCIANRAKQVASYGVTRIPGGS
eukprot:COSAG02_NODE_29589_length_566_cov_1.263383_2_plen_35_part_01